MDEAGKTNRIRGQRFIETFFAGNVIDIGCGDNPVVSHAEPFDLEHGDANVIDGLRPHESYDCVHASHVLEHMHDAGDALRRWWRLVKPGGYLIIVVPDEDLYEQGVWPSRFNNDHKASFRLGGRESWSPVSIDIQALIRDLPAAEILSARLQDHEYDYAKRRFGPENAQSKFLRWQETQLLHRLSARNQLSLPLINEINRTFHDLGATVDQTHGSAMAQIEVVARKALEEAVPEIPEPVAPENTIAASALREKGDDLLKQKRPDEAGDCFRGAIDLDPGNAEAHGNLGIVLQEQGRPDEALAFFRRAVDLKPASAAFHNNLGNALRQKGQLDEAVEVLERAVNLSPDFAKAHYNLANTLAARGRLDEGMEGFHRVLALDPEFPGTHFRLGNACMQQGRLDEAGENYRRALELDPFHAESHGNMGIVLQRQGRLEEAVARYESAIALNPDRPLFHWNLSLTLLLQGEFPRGWEEYEWRWEYEGFPSRAKQIPKPQWNGEDLDGQTIFLHPEQGLGDTLQFVRYVPLVAARGGRVILECPWSLERLLCRIEGSHIFVGAGGTPDDCDVHSPLLGLPRAFGTALADIPCQVPYLSAPPDLVEDWASRLEGYAGRKVGIAWAGSSGHVNDENRSIDPAVLKPLMGIPGVSLFSLQVDRDPAAREIMAAGCVVDLAPHLYDFAETAAAIENLDLVISADTAVVHLAGALAKPVWTLLPFAPDWRWMTERDYSPWYPTMRLFRQSKPGDWKDVVDRVATELAESMDEK
jgi:tetratricopeptide (TPR) repeat protein